MTIASAAVDKEIALTSAKTYLGLLSNAADYQASLQRLMDLDADVLCEGHYGIFRGKQDIVRFVRSFMR